MTCCYVQGQNNYIDPIGGILPVTTIYTRMSLYNAALLIMANSLAVKVQCVSNSKEIGMSTLCKWHSWHNVYSVSFCEMNEIEKRQFCCGGLVLGLSFVTCCLPNFPSIESTQWHSQDFKNLKLMTFLNSLWRTRLETRYSSFLNLPKMGQWFSRVFSYLYT